MSTALALARLSNQSRGSAAGGGLSQLMPEDRPGFLSRALSDAGNLLAGLPRGLFNLAKGAATAPVDAIRAAVDDDFDYSTSSSGEMALEIGRSVAGTANLLFDDLLPLQYVREAARSGDWNPIGGQAAQDYRGRLSEHGQDFLDAPVSFAVENVGNVALAGAVVSRGLGAGALAGREGARAAIGEAGRTAYQTARSAPLLGETALGRTASRASRSVPGALLQRGSARTGARNAALGEAAAEGSTLATQALGLHNSVAHPYVWAGKRADQALGSLLGGGRGAQPLSGALTDIAQRPEWTKKANRFDYISDEVQRRQTALDEGIAELDSARDLTLDQRLAASEQLIAERQAIADRRTELEDFATQNASAIERGHASFTPEGIATLHPLARKVEEVRRGGSNAGGVPRPFAEMAVNRLDGFLDSGRKNISSLTRTLREDLAEQQTAIAGRNTVQGRRDLVNTELVAIRKDLRGAGIDLPRTMRRMTDPELVDVGTKVLKAMEDGTLPRDRYPRLMESDALQRAVLSSYEVANGLPSGAITRQISGSETYGPMTSLLGEARAALEEVNPTALGDLAVRNRAHTGLLEEIPEGAKIDKLPPEIRKVAEQAQEGYRRRVAEQELAKIGRDQIPGAGTRTRVEADGRRVAMEPGERVNLNTPRLSAKQSKTYRAMRSKLDTLEDHMLRTRAILEHDGAFDAPTAVDEIRAMSRTLEGDLRTLEADQARVRAREIENEGRRLVGDEELSMDDLDLSMEPEYIDTAIADLRELYELAELSVPKRLDGERLARATEGSLYTERSGPVRAASQRYANATAKFRDAQPTLDARINLPEQVRKANSMLDTELTLIRKRHPDANLDAVGERLREIGRLYDAADMAHPAWLQEPSPILRDMRQWLHGQDVGAFQTRLRNARKADGERLGRKSVEAQYRLDAMFDERRAAAENLETKKREEARGAARDVAGVRDADRERLAIRRKETAKAIAAFGRMEKRYTDMSTKLDARFNELLNTVEAAPSAARPFLHAARTIAPEMDQLLRDNGLSSLADTLDLNGLPQTLTAMEAAGIDLSYVPRTMLEEAATGQGHYFSSSESFLKTPNPAYTRRRTVGDVAVETNFDMLNIQQQSALMADHMKREVAETVIAQHGRTLQQVLEENNNRLNTLRESDFLTEAQSQGRPGSRSPLLDADALDSLTKTQRERLAAQLGYAYFEPNQIFSLKIRRTGEGGQWLPMSMVDGLRIYKQAGMFEQFMSSVIQPITSKWKNAILALRPGWHVYNAVGSPAMAMAAGAVDLAGYVRHMAGGESSQMVLDYMRGRDMSPYGLDARTARDLLGDNNPLLDRGATPYDPGLAAMNNESVRAFSANAVAKDRKLRSDLREGSTRRLVAEGQGLAEAIRAGAQRARHGANRFIAGSYKANAFVDNLNRATIYLHQTKGLGASPDAALRVAADVLGDYTNMSHVEKLYIRSAIPFYAWVRHITQLMGKLHSPDMITRTLLLEHLTTLASDPREEFADAPSWAQGDIPLGGGVSLATRGFNPFGDALSPLLSADRFDPVKGILAQANPLIQFAAERSTGIDMRTGRPFSRPAPVINADGQEIPTAPGVLHHATETFAPPQIPALANAISDVGRWATGRDPAQRLPTYGSGDPIAIEGVKPRSTLQQLGSLSGLNVRSVDVESAAERRQNAIDRVVSARERYVEELEARRREHEQANVGRNGLPALLLGR